MSGHSFYISSITPEDDVGCEACGAGAHAGRKWRAAYGRGYLMRLSGRADRTLRQAFAAGINFGDPMTAVAWALEARGYPELADAVRKALK